MPAAFPSGAAMTPHAVLAILEAAAGAVRSALDGHDDWGPSGLRDDQYASDLAADRAALDVLVASGLGVVSEESGVALPDAAIWVALDPLDGSTNAHRKLPWFATSLCAVDAEGPLAAVVVDLASGSTFTAIRGEGAWRDGNRLQTGVVTELDQALVAVSSLPPRHIGWQQYRCYGAAALDLCAVASGVFDGYVDFGVDAHGVWDYLGGVLICHEAGATVFEAHGRSLAVRSHTERRTPVVGATDRLARTLRDRRNEVVTAPGAAW